MSGGASASFLQTVSDSSLQAQLASRFGLANFEAVRYLRDLARKTNAPELAQLASRMSTVFRLEQNNGSKDPFSKVKVLITDMIAKLEKDSAEAPGSPCASSIRSRFDSNGRERPLRQKQTR